MTLPDKITLLTQRIAVDVVPNLQHQYPDEDHAHTANGVYSPNESTITLNGSVSGESQRVTMLHECLHAMIEVTGMDQQMETNWGHGAEEALVTALAPVMLAFIRENPLLMRHLSQRMEFD